MAELDPQQAISEQIARMQATGSSLVMNWGEENDSYGGHWEVNWISDGERYLGLHQDLLQALSEAERKALVVLDEGPGLPSFVRQDEVTQLREALDDFAEHGTRSDLNPTIVVFGDFTQTVENYQRYLKQIDDSVRERAQAALDEVPS